MKKNIQEFLVWYFFLRFFLQKVSASQGDLHLQAQMQMRNERLLGSDDEDDEKEPPVVALPPIPHNVGAVIQSNVQLLHEFGQMNQENDEDLREVLHEHGSFVPFPQIYQRVSLRFDEASQNEISNPNEGFLRRWRRNTKNFFLDHENFAAGIVTGALVGWSILNYWSDQNIEFSDFLPKREEREELSTRTETVEETEFVPKSSGEKYKEVERLARAQFEKEMQDWKQEMGEKWRIAQKEKNMTYGEFLDQDWRDMQSRPRHYRRRPGQSVHAGRITNAKDKKRIGELVVPTHYGVTARDVLGIHPDENQTELELGMFKSTLHQVSVTEPKKVVEYVKGLSLFKALPRPFHRFFGITIASFLGTRYAIRLARVFRSKEALIKVLGDEIAPVLVPTGAAAIAATIAGKAAIAQGAVKMAAQHATFQAGVLPVAAIGAEIATQLTQKAQEKFCDVTIEEAQKITGMNAKNFIKPRTIEEAQTEEFVDTPPPPPQRGILEDPMQEVELFEDEQQFIHFLVQQNINIKEDDTGQQYINLKEFADKGGEILPPHRLGDIENLTRAKIVLASIRADGWKIRSTGAIIALIIWAFLCYKKHKKLGNQTVMQAFFSSPEAILIFFGFVPVAFVGYAANYFFGRKIALASVLTLSALLIFLCKAGENDIAKPIKESIKEALEEAGFTPKEQAEAKDKNGESKKSNNTTTFLIVIILLILLGFALFKKKK